MNVPLVPMIAWMTSAYLTPFEAYEVHSQMLARTPADGRAATLDNDLHRSARSLPHRRRRAVQLPDYPTACHRTKDYGHRSCS